jgi:hypothetical protein
MYRVGICLSLKHHSCASCCGGHPCGSLSSGSSELRQRLCSNMQGQGVCCFCTWFGMRLPQTLGFSEAHVHTHWLLCARSVPCIAAMLLPLMLRAGPHTVFNVHFMHAEGRWHGADSLCCW